MKMIQSSPDPNYAYTGLIRPNALPAVRKGSIGDATNTLLVAEKRLNLNFLGAGMAGSDDNQGFAVGFAEDNVRNTTDPTGNTTNPWGPLQDTRSPQPFSGQDKYCFGSSHLFGFNALFADGHVTNIPYSITPSTWQLMGEVNKTGPVPPW